jgi:hypothetical protein
MDNGKIVYGPVHQNIRSTTKTNLISFVKEMIVKSSFPYDLIVIEQVVEHLSQHYCTTCKCQYTYVFAVNFTRFNVDINDSDRELIQWRENDEYDPVGHTRTDMFSQLVKT